MDDVEVAKYWDANAEAWTQLARAGYDTYRDYINTPAFLAMLPDVRGLAGLDIGCGCGHNTRLLAGRGARMTGLDICEKFLDNARHEELADPLGIEYVLASGQALPFADGSFEFATAFMSLMDIPEPERAIREANRVLRPGGVFQFSITHPCFQTRLWKWVLDEQGRRKGVVCGDYFERHDGEVDEWIFGAAPAELKQRFGKFRIPRFDRTLSDWLNTVLDAGFAVERLCEPTPSAEALRQRPDLADARQVAYFLQIRCRKQGTEDKGTAEGRG